MVSAVQAAQARDGVSALRQRPDSGKAVSRRRFGGLRRFGRFGWVWVLRCFRGFRCFGWRCWRLRRLGWGFARRCSFRRGFWRFWRRCCFRRCCWHVRRRFRRGCCFRRGDCSDGACGQRLAPDSAGRSVRPHGRNLARTCELPLCFRQSRKNQQNRCRLAGRRLRLDKRHLCQRSPHPKADTQARRHPPHSNPGLYA